MADTAEIKVDKAGIAGPRRRWVKAFWDMSLHMKVTFVTMASTVGTLLLACIVLVLYDLASFRDHLSHDLALLGDVIADNSKSALVFSDEAAAADTLGALRVQSSIITSCIYDGGDQLFAEYHRGSGEHIACSPKPPATGHQLGLNSVISVNPIILDGEDIGKVYIQSDLHEQYARLTTFGLVALVILAISALIVFTVTTWFISRSAVRPLNALRDIALEFGKGNLQARADVVSSDEIGQLAVVFNRMADQLRITMDSLSERNTILLSEVKERKRAEAALEEARAHLIEAIEVLPEGFAIWDADDCFVMANSKYLEMFEPASDILVPGVGYARFLTKAVDCGVYDAGGKPIGEYIAERLEVHRNPDAPYEKKLGNSTWVRISKNVTKAGGIVGTWEDVTDAKKAHETIQKLAFTDPLTGLANRHKFYTRFSDALTAAGRLKKQVALLFVDLDKFKEINDTHGHATGDALLVEVANRLREEFRKVDTVARLGGDEFAIIATNLQDASDINVIADRVVKRIAEPILIDGLELDTAASIGISFYPNDDTDADQLIRKADLALYQAKDGGRNTYRLYDDQMHQASRARKEIEKQLELAVKREEFVLYYQPLINTSDNRVSGAEALIRWQHPERGIVPPMEFIPIVESSGLIVPIGEWVLRQACAQNKAWQDAGLPPFRLAVNISPRQFQDENLFAVVESALEQAGLEPKWLELEITEGVFIEDISTMSARLEQFRELGVGLSIDDFGTGFSSLSYLTRLPVHRFKIDRSFVKNLSTDRNDEAIVKAVVNLAHSLDLKVVAEGVETSRHLEHLRRLNCDEVQGYYFSRPLPASEFAEWVSAHESDPASAVGNKHRRA